MSRTKEFRNEALSKSVSSLLSDSSHEYLSAPLIGRTGNVMATAIYIDALKVLVVKHLTDFPMRYGFVNEDHLEFIDFATGPFISKGDQLKKFIRSGKEGLESKMKNKLGNVEVDKIYLHDPDIITVDGKKEEREVIIMTLKPSD